jgi:hypothetical protein
MGNFPVYKTAGLDSSVKIAAAIAAGHGML